MFSRTHIHFGAALLRIFKIPLNCQQRVMRSISTPLRSLSTLLLIPLGCSCALQHCCLKKNITWAPGLIQHTKWRRITTTLLQTILISIPRDAALSFTYCTLMPGKKVALTTCISKHQFSLSLLYRIFVVLLSSLYKWATEAQGLRSQVTL